MNWRYLSHHRTSIRAYLDGESIQTTTGAILVLLIESAVLYCGVWVSDPSHLLSWTSLLNFRREWRRYCTLSARWHRRYGVSGRFLSVRPMWLFQQHSPKYLCVISLWYTAFILPWNDTQWIYRGGNTQCRIQGFYPTAIIVIVALQRTAWDMTASARVTPTAAMDFAMHGVAISASSLSTGFTAQTTRRSVEPSIMGHSSIHSKRYLLNRDRESLTATVWASFCYPRSYGSRISFVPSDLILSFSFALLPH